MTSFVDEDNGSSLKEKARRVINFDIDQNLLKENYPYSSKIHGPKTYTNAYGKIQKYMGFLIDNILHLIRIYL